MRMEGLWRDARRTWFTPVPIQDLHPLSQVLDYVKSVTSDKHVERHKQIIVNKTSMVYIIAIVHCSNQWVE